MVLCQIFIVFNTYIWLMMVSWDILKELQKKALYSLHTYFVCYKTYLLEKSDFWVYITGVECHYSSTSSGINEIQINMLCNMYLILFNYLSFHNSWIFVFNIYINFMIIYLFEGVSRFVLMNTGIWCRGRKKDISCGRFISSCEGMLVYWIPHSRNSWSFHKGRYKERTYKAQ